MVRIGKVKRETKETQISLELNLDGQGRYTGKSNLPFLDHMLTLWAANSLCNLEIKATGDLEVDAHHTVEDLGICLGEATAQALGEKEGIARYGAAFIPMDEALVLAVVDFSGRPYLAFHLNFPSRRLGEFETELVKEFLWGFVRGAELTLHLYQLSGENTHHLAEAAFKAWAQAFRQAVSFDPRREGIPSTKGVL